jgi:hypothetical protein
MSQNVLYKIVSVSFSYTLESLEVIISVRFCSTTWLGLALDSVRCVCDSVKSCKERNRSPEYSSTLISAHKFIRSTVIVIYEPSAGRRCSRMSAFFKARATKERVPLINARMNGRCLHASGSYNIFCTKIKLNFFVFNTLKHKRT